MNSYGNRGMAFEAVIEMANKRYRQIGEAIIEKQHTLCKPIRNKDGRVVGAKYDEKATVDFMGRYGSIPIAFEAKDCSGDKIELSRVQEHQCRFLEDWTKCGAIGFVLVSFRRLENVYVIPWECWKAARWARADRAERTVLFPAGWKAWNATGKASIRSDELPMEWRVPLSGGVDYLRTVGRLWGK